LAALGGLWLVWIIKVVQDKGQIAIEPFQKIAAPGPREEAKRPPRGGGSGAAKAALWQLAKHLIVAFLEGQLCGRSCHS